MEKKHPQQRAQKTPSISILSIGGSIFVMFFGAGNIVFPLALGYQHHAHPWFACLGMLFTAVFVPLMGLLAMLLYAGDYQSFFRSVGKIPGNLFILLILCLIGPFGGIPRAIAISYSTLEPLFPVDHGWMFSSPVFSFLSCVFIYLFACRLSKLLQWLGSFFFPIILGTLICIIYKALSIDPHPSAISSYTPGQSWFAGLVEGFNTMDLLAGFFFCSIVLVAIRQQLAQQQHHTDQEAPLDFQKVNKASRIRLTLGFILAAALLSAIYLGFTLCAARHANILNGVPTGQILGRISQITLGPKNLLTGICVFVACLTTEIALVGIIADFLARSVMTMTRSKYTMTYPTAVILALIPSYLMSILNFENISQLLLPLLQLSYPALIVLTFGNIAHKLWHFRYTALLFYATLISTILFQPAMTLFKGKTELQRERYHKAFFVPAETSLQSQKNRANRKQFADKYAEFFTETERKQLIDGTFTDLDRIQVLIDTKPLSE